METENNLLLKLHKWARRQDENFTSDAFVHLLNHLADYDPFELAKLLNRLSGKILNFEDINMSSLIIKSQVVSEEGTPDIEIRTNYLVMLIEVKVESDFQHEQLKRYRDYLKKQGSDKTTCLIALTQYPFIFNPSVGNPDITLRWHHIVDYLDELKLENQVSIFLVNQFINFLKTRNIAMDNVKWEFVTGLQSFQNLMNMVAEALAANNISIHQKSPTWNWYGYYLESKKYFVGIYFDKPNQLFVNTEVEVVIKDGEEPKIGFIGDNGGWLNSLVLDSEEIHFFARSKASQIQCVERFIQESIDYAKTIIK